MMRAPQTSLPLTLSNVRFAAGGVEILRGITLTISPGAPTIILGPNGAGKSVTLRLCQGLLQPTTGEIQAGSFASLLERSALVFQRPVMLRRSALANVAYGMTG
ncbi:MAG TPA: ATP-binding cassette domain-containing protein, partial [Xanthobacteraceae bacterium]|nr:ATP-binding cassette domain-containing protein [Xanthobacteraceae bacterium]